MEIKKPTCWDDLRDNADRLTNLIEEELKKKPPVRIADVLRAVNKVDGKCDALPNPTSTGHYCQLIVYTSHKWQTWPRISMDISAHNLYN